VLLLSSSSSLELELPDALLPPEPPALAVAVWDVEAAAVDVVAAVPVSVVPVVSVGVSAVVELVEAEPEVVVVPVADVVPRRAAVAAALALLTAEASELRA